MFERGEASYIKHLVAFLKANSTELAQKLEYINLEKNNL
jgi:hypothetical protein